MKTVALYNIKGGVGKSTTAVNLACLAAQEGDRTLLWDLDPQGAAGYFLGQAGPAVHGSRKLIQGKQSFLRLVIPTKYPLLDVLPSRFSYRKMDIHLQEQGQPRKALSALLGTLPDSYRWIFLDCPPGITLLSESVFRAADLLLVPLVPTPLSLRTFEEIVIFFQRKKLDRTRIVPFFSLVEQRKKIHRTTMEIFSARELGVCRAFIPSLSDIERMAVTRRPVALFKPLSKAGRAYQALWAEIKVALNDDVYAQGRINPKLTKN